MKALYFGLPRLRVAAIDDEGLFVCFWERKCVGVQSIACIVLASAAFIWGRFTSVNVRNREGRFAIEEGEESCRLHIGEEYNYLDGYWGPRAELVLDQARKWKRADFQPSDAVSFKVNGQNISGKWGSPPFEGAQAIHRVDGGWTHEHCSICWETIGPSGRKTGYCDQSDVWVCEMCYDSYIVPKKLDFIPGTKEECGPNPPRPAS